MTIVKKWAMGWKQIGEYINRTAQTAKRYYKKYGMPIRRDPSGKPMALLSEIDEWLIGFTRSKKK